MIVIIVNTMTIVLLSFFIFIRWKACRTILEPGIVFSINLILLYPVRAIVLYTFKYDGWPSYEDITYPDNIEVASWIALIGCIGYVSGYLFVIGQRKILILRKTAGQNLGKSNLSTLLVLFSLSLIGVAYKVATNDYISYLLAEGRNTGFSQIATLLTSLQWPAFFGAWIIWFEGRRDKKFLALFSIIMLVVVPYQFLQGSKTFLSLLLVSVIISNYWATGKIPRFSIIVGVLLVSIYVFPYVHNFREYINSAYGKIPSISELSVKNIVEMTAGKSEDSVEKAEGLMAISARYAGIDELYNLTQIVPNLLDHRYGLDYSAFFVNLIPRAVWPGKPIYSRGAEYGTSLGTITSVTPFPIGEAFWDFGKYGVFIMMAVWGGCLAGLLRGYDFYYKKNGKSQLVLFYFLYQIYWISGGETSMPMVLSGLPQQFVMLWAVSKIISETEKFGRKINVQRN
jgi:hypothetical protein